MLQSPVRLHSGLPPPLVSLPTSTALLPSTRPPPNQRRLHSALHLPLQDSTRRPPPSAVRLPSPNRRPSVLPRHHQRHHHLDHRHRQLRHRFRPHRLHPSRQRPKPDCSEKPSTIRQSTKFSTRISVSKTVRR